jgi:DNA primase
MNCKQANQLDINQVLKGLGVDGKPAGNNCTLYCSPLRQDDKPSFAVYADTNKWHDFGSGESGTLVDLVMKLHNCTTGQALAILAKNEPTQPAKPFLFKKQNEVEKIYSTDSKFQNVRIGQVTDTRLIDYLASRGISCETWSQQKQLHQINYTTVGKQGNKYHCFNLAWQTDSGSFELRGTGNFKGCFGHKDITTIPGTGKDLNLFEGFFDYLSALEYFRAAILKNTTIVLNSLTNIKKAMAAIEQAEIVNLFLDNDPPGTGAANNLYQKTGNCINRSLELYPNHHDFNDFLNLKTHEYRH